MTGIERLFYLLLLVLAQNGWAARLSDSISYYPQELYDQIERGTENSELKDFIHRILSSAHIKGAAHDSLARDCSGRTSCYQHVSLGYSGARRVLFGELHLIKHGKGHAILDVYCEELMSARPGQIPNSNVLNAEHTWPQSRFSRQFNTGQQKSDLHALYPVLAHANSARGNIEFGDIVSPVSSPCPASKRGYTARGGSETFFEVPAAHKGNVARAIFYFSTRYKLPVSELEEDSLKAWHRQDPPDQAERDRNEAIFAKQKVRNPFIDHPELVELIENF
jgi:deoxyribonuclease I